MLNRSLKLICTCVVTLTILSACNNTADVKKAKTQQEVDNLSNRINVQYKKKNGVVNKNGKVGNDGVVNDKESRRVNNK